MSESYDFSQHVDESSELFIDPTGEVPDWIPDNDPNMYPEVPTVDPIDLETTEETVDVFVDPSGEDYDWIPDNDPTMTW